MHVWSILVCLGIFPWACIKIDISYIPWNMMTSGDRRQGCVMQVQDENQEEFICLKFCHPYGDYGQANMDMREALPY